MPFCTQCGSRNPDGAKFCAQCGTRLVMATPGDAGAGRTPSGGDQSPATSSDATSTVTFGAPANRMDADEQSGLDPDDAEAVSALPQGSALLIVQRGPGAGNRFLLDQDTVTAGRHPESEIFLDDITVSRRHVEFRRGAGGSGGSGGYSVHDVGSLNGTYVNRDRIDESALQNGDEVQVGKFRLVYFAGEAAADA